MANYDAQPQNAPSKPKPPKQPKSHSHQPLIIPSQPPRPPGPQSHGYVQAIYIQRLLMWTMGRKGTTAVALSRLAVAWCQVEERKRILKGIPLPGQYHPDLDPVRLARRIQARQQRFISDMPAAAQAGPRASFEEPEPEPSQPKAEPEGPAGAK